jgi:hypothetical protein
MLLISLAANPGTAGAPPLPATKPAGKTRPPRSQPRVVGLNASDGKSRNVIILLLRHELRNHGMLRPRD